MLEGVDDNPVGTATVVDDGLVDSKEIWDLADSDVDGRASDESGDGGSRDEVNHEAKAQEAHCRDERAGDDCEHTGDLMSGVLGDVDGRLVDNGTHEGRHDSDGADCDIFGGGEEPVDQDTHEGGVETILNVEIGQLGVGHGLGDDDCTNGDTCFWSVYRAHFEALLGIAYRR